MMSHDQNMGGNPADASNDVAARSPQALEGVRVLDLAGPTGVYCGKLLADLGADVIRIEPPGGDESRRIGPFYGDEPAPERSLFHWHFNANKRGVTLDLDTADGRRLFRRLSSSADIVVETFMPGYLESIALGFDSLIAINAKLILVSITPFGRTGPFNRFEGGELIGQAAGGLLWMCGWPDRPPVMMGGGPAMHQASAEAAAGALIALYAAEETGRGQHVDVSTQACMPMTLMTSVLDFYLTGARRLPRVGNRLMRPLNGMFACKDGYVDFRFRGRPGQWQRLVAWLDSAGMAEDLGDECWSDHAYRDEPEHTRHINDTFQRFLMRFTKEEAMDIGQRGGYEVGAVYTAEDILHDPQLETRRFWVELEHQELGRSFRYPGGPYVMTETPWRLERRAPLLGEHNVDVYGGMLGLRPDELESLRAAKVI
jgi:crotonobetainyl-CoA:carnitine CoA-transferase CaiB-like acyl-CoA transferase